jgi:hypothetical protein
MRYAVGAGGKRVRPLIAMGSALAAGGRAEDAAYPAAAIELLHNYTLVHDDLPSMDNDEMRRGKPTVWKKFGEVNAILAGDALQALAFSAAAKTPKNAAKIVAALAEAGAAAEHVVRTRVMLTRAEDFAEIAAAHGEVFRDIKPVNTSYVVAALLDPRWLLEVELEAFVPE